MASTAVATAAIESLAGRVATVMVRFDLGDIEEYRRRSGDTNRLHYDADFAAKSLFRRPVVPAALVCERLPGLATRLLGDGWAFIGLANLTVTAPIFPEEEVRVTAMVTKHEGRQAEIVAKAFSRHRDTPVIRADILCNYVMRRNAAVIQPD